MTAPVLRQTRDSVVLTDGSVKFVVTAEMQSAGTGTDALPCKEVFVFSIVDTINPKADAFARIATPLELRMATDNAFYVKVLSTDIHIIGGDPFARVANAGEITSLARTREEALLRGQTEYLASIAAFTYADVPTATAAFQTVIERLSHLLTDWKALRDGFLSVSSSYSLPVADIGVRTSTQAAYYAARQVRIDAETVRDEANAAKTTSATALAYQQQLQSLLQNDVTALQAGIDAVRPMEETALYAPALPGGTTVTFAYAVKNFVLGGDARSFLTFYNNKLTALGRQRVAVQTYTGQYTVASQQYNTAVLAVEAARITEEAALAAARAACPLFTPTPE